MESSAAPDGYELRGLIAKGGMGSVHRALDIKHQRVVALKLVDVRSEDQAEYRERFLRESRLTARVEHQNVVPVYDFGTAGDGGTLYLAMRLIHGANIGQIVAREGALSAVRAVRILDQVASALDAAHRVGLVHRDVKPQNILLDRADKAYLIDFGIAKSVDDPRLTRSGGVIGTPPYMAPEVFEGRGSTVAADIYGLGCTFFYMLTGHQANHGDTFMEFYADRFTASPPRPSLYVSDLSIEFDQVIARSLALNPAARYHSAGEMAEAAGKVIDGSVASVATMTGPHFVPSAPTEHEAEPEYAYGSSPDWAHMISPDEASSFDWSEEVRSQTADYSLTPAPAPRPDRSVAVLVAAPLLVLAMVVLPLLLVSWVAFAAVGLALALLCLLLRRRFFPGARKGGSMDVRVLELLQNSEEGQRQFDESLINVIQPVQRMGRDDRWSAGGSRRAG